MNDYEIQGLIERLERAERRLEALESNSIVKQDASSVGDAYLTFPIGQQIPDCDDVSTDQNDYGDIQVKGWKTQNSDDKSIAQCLDDATPGNVAVVVRDGGPNGTLRYVPIGSFQQGGTSSTQPTVEIVGDVMYDLTDHQLKKRMDSVNLRTGAVAQGNYVMIIGGQATPHSGE